MSRFHEETIDGIIVRETEEALLLEVKGSEEEVWLPLSQVSAITRRGHGQEYDEVTIPTWLAQAKGLL